MYMRLIGLVAVLVLAQACSSTIVNREPVGESFPNVRGQSLAGEQFLIPGDFKGAPVILLIGYKQRTQFDLDRWILGLVQLGTPVRIIEVPTIKGLVPGLFANQIDNGMRKGIPEEDWGSVVTVYDEAAPIVAFTGNENASNGRIVLLDENGQVAWFTDRGYSAGQVKELDTLVRSLSTKP
ncbi:MAG: hypothetical protein HOI23_12985 [Deltaproteobacteria bacterium]|jgi:hypothetical protein|nr:hypothetical protein [Deltaproteobacteria bacterium]